MRIIAFSDSHGSLDAVERIYQSQPNADCFLFLGDGYDQIKQLRKKYPLMPLLAVRGNCDIYEKEADTKTTVIADKKILYTHGHRFDVKMGYGAIKHEARKIKADIVLFGHTHIPTSFTDDGIFFVNPGSARTYGGTVRYAIIDILDGQIFVSLAED